MSQIHGSHTRVRMMIEEWIVARLMEVESWLGVRIRQEEIDCAIIVFFLLLLIVAEVIGRVWKGGDKNV